MLTEAGWKFTVLNQSYFPPRRVVNVEARIHANMRELYVEARHLICESRLCITIRFQELQRLLQGSHQDDLLEAIYIAKTTIIQSHTPCPYLLAKVMVYNKEEAEWESKSR